MGLQLLIRLSTQICYAGLDCVGAGALYSGFANGNGPIWLDLVTCYGNEATLLACPRNPFGHHYCNHEQDAGVSCSKYTMYIT